MKNLPELEDFIITHVQKLGYPKLEICRDFRDLDKRQEWKNYLRIREVANDLHKFIQEEINELPPDA